MGGDHIGDAELRFVTETGDEVVSRVREHTMQSLRRVQPVRRPPTRAGQRHYPGFFWTRTTRDHVIYESLLERDRILLADFDNSVTWISAQPFWISGKHQGRVRRHCPDLLLALDNGSFVIVDVKHPRVARKDEVREVFAWTREVCERLSAEFEVWTGADATVMINIRFVSQARRESRSRAFHANIERLPELLSITDAEAAFAKAGIDRPRHLVFELIWNGQFDVDLTRPLGGDSLLHRIEAV